MNASIVKQIHEPLVPQVRQILAVKESKRVYKNVKFEMQPQSTPSTR